MRALRTWWRETADLVLPTGCAGCGRPGAALCAHCRETWYRAAVRAVRPAVPPPGLPPVYAAVDYADRARAVLLAHKERGALELAVPLGAALAAAVRAAAPAPGPLLLVPVPSARRAVAARGHDPVLRIARAAARELRRRGRAAGVSAVLRQRRAVADQSGLRAPQRLANLAGALAAVPGAGRLLAAGPMVVLVDDLIATGASLADAARAVRDAGGGVAGAAVVAATAPRCSVRAPPDGGRSDGV